MNCCRLDALALALLTACATTPPQARTGTWLNMAGVWPKNFSG
jgi:hypothetical protein